VRLDPFVPVFAPDEHACAVGHVFLRWIGAT
jgi:hypothetical protein